MSVEVTKQDQLDFATLVVYEFESLSIEDFTDLYADQVEDVDDLEDFIDDAYLVMQDPDEWVWRTM